MKNTNKKLSKIFTENIERYSNRYRNMKYDVRTLGWGTWEQQNYRFLQTMYEKIDFTGKRILDIGCGFGDYYVFLKNQNIEIGSYIGWDLNPDLIGEARKRLTPEKNVTFKIRNIFDEEIDKDIIADIVVMIGVLNFNLKDTFDNYEYSKSAIKKAFHHAKEVLIVDFLSEYREDSYPKEDFVFYHKPEIMLEYALSLTKDVFLKHNYMPIPQKEFMLFMYK